MTKNGKAQLLYRTYAFTKNLSFLIFQILSVKFRKISPRKKFNDKRPSKIEKRAQREKNACSKKKIEGNNTIS